ncbi:MAG TPA: M24 family metallopeptidase [Verrucomicrobiae bacterium]|jgi:Xaa-Pro dipeptidase|nr:M24 family metallopeptidase [Verrucomicrobiae bacterium]
MDLKAIQAALRERNFDAWLFYDHHHRDPIAYKVLGLSEGLFVTRRWFYLIPRDGDPVKLVHRIEAGHLDTLPGSKRAYSSWRELWDNLQSMLTGVKTVAMQYSPNNLVPYIGLVDAGTVELVRSFGKDIVSSGDLVARFEAAWTEEQIQSHFAARDAIDAIVPATFQEIGRRARNGGVTEYEIQQWIAEAFRREKLVTEDLPIVGVNANSGNPHYEPKSVGSARIKAGDFVLLDMWAKKNTPNAVYYDITWTGVIGTPSEKQKKIFEIVRDGRDAGIRKVQDAYAARRRIAGWEVDQATREHISDAGFGEYFIHRTGHSIGESVHGNGANMDNLETKDEREIIPHTCFSIEPGIYLPGEFGVRSEVNVLIRKGAAEVTGKIQRELVLI